MHKSEIPAAVRERVAAMRGGAPPLPLVPSRTAHIIVDLQNGFMAPGAPVELESAREIVPNVNRISQALRAAGGTNVFIRFTTDLEEPHYWRPMWDTMAPEGRSWLVDAFIPKTHFHELWPGLDVAPGELVVDKTRFSAFIPGTCDLHDKLQALGVDTLIITGCVTNCCCESTARDAMQMGYQVFFIEDGNAAMNDADHNATLSNMCGLFFAEVLDTDAMTAKISAAFTAEAA